MKRFVLAAVAVLALAGCLGKPPDQTPPPAPAPKPPAAADVYRSCVGSDRSKEDACQIKAWGETFSDDDERWLCDVMGNWDCGPGERKA